jgi:hypothetical protein
VADDMPVRETASMVSGDVCVAFGGGVRHAFVERTQRADTPEMALAVLADHVEGQVTYRLARWRREHARVTALDDWDVGAGQRDPQPV